MAPIILPEVKLFTPDPHHLPGYCGWFPEKLTNSVGRTFARVTHDNLTAHHDPKCKSILLCNNNPQRQQQREQLIEAGEQRRIEQHAVKSGGHPKWKGYIAPHYTGDIPHERQMIGTTFEHGIQSLLAEHERHCAQHEQEERDIVQQQNVPPLELRECMEKPFVFHSAHEWIKDAENPYFSRPGHPLKYFIPGTGYVVPLWQNHFGHTYAEATRNCLTEFTIRHEAYLHSKENPFHDNNVAATRSSQRARSAAALSLNGATQQTTVLPAAGSAIPGYTGHIPATKFRFGMPFNQCAKVFRYGLVWPPYDSKVGMHKNLEEQVLNARGAEFEHQEKLARLKAALRDSSAVNTNNNLAIESC